MVVIDASAAVCLLAGRPAGSIQGLTERLANEELHASYLIDI